jgi:modification methylase
MNVLKKLDSESVDLIFTSPPYNLGLKSNTSKNAKWKKSNSENGLVGGYEDHDDDMPREKYIIWQKEVLTECWRVIKPTGAIYYNHKPRVQKLQLQTPLELNPGLPLRQIIIWKRSGGMNFSERFYVPSHEWIMIFAKPDFKLRDRKASGALDVWDIPHERTNSHPAPFPVDLPFRAIQTTDAKIICDPFMGSGTTGCAAVRLGREFIGIELSKKYFDQATTRIQKEIDDYNNNLFFEK